MIDPSEVPIDDSVNDSSTEERLDRGPDLAPPSVPNVICRRCGKSVEPATFCVYCRVRLQPEDGVERKARPRASSDQALVRCCFIFTGMVLVTLVFGWIGRFAKEPIGVEDRSQFVQQLTGLTVAETIDLCLVAFAIVWVGRVPSPKKPRRLVRIACWVSAVPVLVGLLGVNFAYHWLVNAGLGLDAGEPNYRVSPNDWLAVWLVAVHCLQPALLEEFFFRRLALGALRTVSGIHAAVLVSSIMFGVAHIGALFSIPLFIGIGMVLGYMRVLSGGIALPILLHFAHNAAITYLQYFR